LVGGAEGIRTDDHRGRREISSYSFLSPINARSPARDGAQKPNVLIELATSRACGVKLPDFARWYPQALAEDGARKPSVLVAFATSLTGAGSGLRISREWPAQVIERDIGEVEIGQRVVAWRAGNLGRTQASRPSRRRRLFAFSFWVSDRPP
jgi:hypothetical protein